MNQRLRNIIGAQLDVDEMSNYYPERRIVCGQGVRPYIIMNGRKILQFASLDYLGLATDERVTEAEVQATRKYGSGALPSRLIAELEINRELERKIAEFMNTEDSVVFTSGSTTNQGTIPAVIASQLSHLCPGNNTHATRAVFIDWLTHASCKDAISLTRGARVKTIEYDRGGMDDSGLLSDLERLISIHHAELNLIITDGIASTNGRVIPLRGVCEIAEKYEAAIFVDDAHATAVLGENGRGTCELLGVEDKVDIRMGVISKALGTMGGFIVGEEWFIEYLRHSRPQIHSMPLPPGECGATIKAIEIARKEPWRRQKVLRLAEYLRSHLQEIGFDTLGSTTQIVPVFIGDELLARQFADDLEEQGIFCPPFEYPAVPEKQALLRFCPTALHEQEDIDRLLDTISKLFQKYLSLTHVCPVGAL